MAKAEAKALRAEIAALATRVARDEPDAFAIWFLMVAVVGDDEKSAQQALTGAAGDKNMDAIHVDHDAREVVVIQTKYRRDLMEHSESRNDVLSFARLTELFFTRPSKRKEFSNKLAVAARESFDKASQLLRGDKKYRLALYFATTGKISHSIRAEAKKCALTIPDVTQHDAARRVQLTLLDGKALLDMKKEWDAGAAPPIQTVRVEIQGDSRIEHSHERKGVRSVFACVRGDQLAKLHHRCDRRLYARNIRGYRGETAVNERIQETIQEAPENFWYFNNGVTVVCRGMTVVEREDKFLELEWPQIINGQQTTRTLALLAHESRKCDVLVKVYEVSGDLDAYDEFINSIVVATNFQNAVSIEELKANDSRQIQLERQLRRRGYGYARKKETKQEARARFRGVKTIMSMTELAYAVAATIFDPYVLRAEKSRLWNEEYSRVFRGNNPNDYLVPFYLMKAVQMKARGSSERTYMKWLAIRFVWDKLESSLDAHERATAFVNAFETRQAAGRDVVDSLLRMVQIAFDAGLRYYKKMKSAEMDVNNFMRQRDHDVKLERFWRTRHNGKRRKAFAVARDAFEAAIEDHMQRSSFPV